MEINNSEDIFRKLWRIFWVSVVLPLSLFVVVVVVLRLGIRYSPPGNIRIWGIVLFVLSVTFGVAIPVLLRTSFYGKFVKCKSVSVSEYINYQKFLIIVCSTAIISSSVSYLFIVSSLYMYGSILAALYGVYSVIPFQMKIGKEVKIFRLENS